MARDTIEFICQACGGVHGKWAGQCPSCGAWNTLVQETGSAPPGAMKTHQSKSNIYNKNHIQFESLELKSIQSPRLITGLSEFDRVCGGGVVRGSVLLLAGDPGVGKSTLLLQVMASAANAAIRCGYISGEEANEQICGRAVRMGLSHSPVNLASETSLRLILDAIKREKFDLVIIDSIQTFWSDAIEAAQGSVSQVRACASELVRLAKKQNVAIILVGHVTKEGQIAGPRVVEHMVDAVLSFEGERGYPFRILRGVKNRFGAVDEIGVFEMSDKGLREVSNPSALFLSEGNGRASGSCVFAAMEGSRPVLVEIQALVAQTSFGTPRRAVVGWDSGRLAMILAVLESRCGISYAQKDVYLNVAGGMKISEPAADLAVAMALLSALSDTPLPEKAVIFGEISLSGDIRDVTRSEIRLKEAHKLGFESALCASTTSTNSVISVKGLANLKETLNLFDLEA